MIQIGPEHFVYNTERVKGADIPKTWADCVNPKWKGKLGFEDALQQLEEIVRGLESGKGKLEDSIKSYERGTLLKQHCEDKLREAQMRIDKIVVGADGIHSEMRPYVFPPSKPVFHGSISYRGLVHRDRIPDWPMDRWMMWAGQIGRAHV